MHNPPFPIVRSTLCPGENGCKFSFLVIFSSLCADIPEFEGILSCEIINHPHANRWITTHYMIPLSSFVITSPGDHLDRRFV